VHEPTLTATPWSSWSLKTFHKSFVTSNSMHGWLEMMTRLECFHTLEFLVRLPVSFLAIPPCLIHTHVLSFLSQTIALIVALNLHLNFLFMYTSADTF
jgi:hypothetical protein